MLLGWPCGLSDPPPPLKKKHASSLLCTFGQAWCSIITWPSLWLYHDLYHITEDEQLNVNSFLTFCNRKLGEIVFLVCLCPHRSVYFAKKSAGKKFCCSRTPEQIQEWIKQAHHQLALKRAWEKAVWEAVCRKSCLCTFNKLWTFCPIQLITLLLLV